MTPIETHFTKLLDQLQIPYRVLPHEEPVFTMEAAARQRGVVKDEMLKSILLVDKDERYVMACVTGEARVNPKAVRAHLPQERRRLSFANADQIQKVTGSVMGAVTPLGLPPEVPVIFDEAVLKFDKVNISSGDPMAGLELEVDDLIRVVRPIFAPIADIERDN